MRSRPSVCADERGATVSKTELEREPHFDFEAAVPLARSKKPLLEVG
jgi:hypothetical protein